MMMYSIQFNSIVLLSLKISQIDIYDTQQHKSELVKNDIHQNDIHDKTDKTTYILNLIIKRR